MWARPIDMDRPWWEHCHWNGPSENDDLFGVELEIEGQKITVSSDNADFFSLWKRKDDNSLRKNKPGDEAWEYYFRHPLNLKRTEEAVSLLEKEFTRKGTVVYESGRTSVHVHINCMNEKMRTIYNFITLAYIFEELLVSQNGFHRIGNNFCLRAKDAQGILIYLTKSINSRGNLAELPQEYRYSATNVASLFKFGTIEFRSLECTVSKDRIMNWIKILQTLKEAARRFKNPRDIISRVSLIGPDRFIAEQLGMLLAYPYLKVPNHTQMIQNGMRLVQEFANSSTWEAMEINKAKELPKPTKKKGPFGNNAVMNAHWAEIVAQQQTQVVAQPTAPPQGNLVQPGDMIFFGGNNWNLVPPEGQH